MSEGAETRLVKQIRDAVATDMGLRLWRNNTGVAKSKGFFIRYGLCNGSADLVGVLAPQGRFVALEVKTAKGRVDPIQDTWLDIVRSMGGFACVVRSVDEAKAAVERARAGKSE